MKKILFPLIAITLTAISLTATPKAIVFDFGGVLTKNQNRESVITFIRQSFHFSVEEFEKANQEKRLAVKQGKTDQEFWIFYAKNKAIKLPDNWTTSFKSVMKEAIGVNSAMYSLVAKLKEQQITVGLLSNIDERLSNIVRECDLYDPFDPCLLSCEIGVEKPDIKAYKLLLNTLNLPANEIVFIDDRPENIEAAKTIGLDAILFESESQLRNELSTRGSLK